MIAYRDALRLVLAEARPLPRQEVALAQAMGRFTADEVRSPSSLPPFPNSAMDGFAMVAGAGGLPAGTRLRVAGRVAAGDALPGAREGSRAEGAGAGATPAAPGTVAWEIMTGAPVPDGLDTVVPVERVEVEEKEGAVTSIRLLDPEEAGKNIRPAGADFSAGDRVLARGCRIGPVEAMALAALGITGIPVHEDPAVAVLSTGPELVDDPREALAPGRIRNSNGPYLAGVLEAEGVRVLARRTLGDEEEPFRQAVSEALERGARLVVSTGAVSMGRYDFVPAALERMGATLLFHRAAIRPGKPILAAVLPGGAVHFGLPGNPISAAVGYRFFILPFLRALRGQAPERPWRMALAGSRTKPAALRQFLKGRVEIGPHGVPEAHVLPGQQSFRVAPLLETNAWVVLPEGTGEVEEGTPVEVFGLHGPLLRG